MLLHAIERIFLYFSSGVPAELYPFWGQQKWAAKINKWLLNKMLRKLSFLKQKTPWVGEEGGGGGDKRKKKPFLGKY